MQVFKQLAHFRCSHCQNAHLFLRDLFPLLPLIDFSYSTQLCWFEHLYCYYSRVSRTIFLSVVHLWLTYSSYYPTLSIFFAPLLVLPYYQFCLLYFQRATEVFCFPLPIPSVHFSSFYSLQELFDRLF